MSPELFTTPSLREVLLGALRGLSVADAPARAPEFFSMAVDHHSDLDARTFAALIGAPDAPSVEDHDVDAFVARALVPTDAGASAVAGLLATLHAELRELRVFLVHAAHGPDHRPARYVVGWDADGRLAGLRLPVGV
jgi:hypothetical protein